MKSELKFVIDVGVGKVVENWIKALDFDTISVRELNPKMPDVDILKLAEKENRIVITMDKDFGELVFSRKKKHDGVILLRLDDATSLDKLAVVRLIFSKYENQLSGNFCVYQNNTLRIRKK